MNVSPEEVVIFDRLREAYACPRRPYPVHMWGERLDGSFSCLLHTGEVRPSSGVKTPKKTKKSIPTLINGYNLS